MTVNLRALIGKLNHATRAAVEGGAGLCLSRTHYDVEVEHFLAKVLDDTHGDAAAILRHFGLDRSRLEKDLDRALDRLKTGNARTPALSPSLVRMLTEAWMIGSVDFGATQVRTGHALLALVGDADLARMAAEISRELAKISAETLRKELPQIVGESAEEQDAQRGGGDASAGGGQPAAGGRPGKSPNLDQFTIDLTGRAREGRIDPVLGRDAEIRQVVDILTRRRQNNPILVGEAGVGKTAVIEGFALRVVAGDVPPVLRNITIRTLDLALLQAGAGVKGEFENRLKGLIDEVKRSPTPIVLFIDEAHTMIGAGGQAGQGDAANLLKPALARGELRTLAATTWSEYKKYFEKDPALARRFQLVKVDEPSETKCEQMMRGVAPALETHHNVRILDEGLAAAVRLSHRYLPDRQLPDKAVSVLDTACARLALGQSTTPPAIEDAQRQLDDLAVQSRVLEREQALGVDHAERLGEIETKRKATQERLVALTARWDGERALVERIREIRGQLEASSSEARQDAAAGALAASAAASADAEALRVELARLNADLEQLQGEAPLMRVCVDASIVGEVIANWTGIPLGKMMRDEMETMLKLEQYLGARVIGQGHALEVISRRVRTSKAGIEDPNKPKGVFMLVGPSGVGKTETALQIADLLYGGEQNVITINM
ncbi:MAG TPA: type VI secretion system ATPase TssH, partial [Gemmatimonadaceae bacterium]|nr:type VI secretion system ATPase TssH [Gemmatimonadaceae bacterium]